MKCMRCTGFCGNDIRWLQAAYGLLDAHIHGVIMCGIKYQAGHCSSPVNELLHLRKMSPL